MNPPLTPEQWRHVNALFHEALDLDPGERTTFLERSAGDDRLRNEVETLLESYSQVDDFLETPVTPLFSNTLGKGHDVFSPGEIIGDFRVVKTLGSGSFATVYLAEQISLNRKVALKVSANFGKEARNMAPLEHDNIVKVFSETLDPARDILQICMQYVPGATLESLIAELAKYPKESLSGKTLLAILDRADNGETAFNPTALEDREKLSRLDYQDACLWLGLQVADALAYAHDRGVLHLDVKPGNILISPYGRPLLTDFNISLRRGDVEDRRSNMYGGTLNYMAPEHAEIFQAGQQAEAIARIDQRADIFSLGVVMKELLNLSDTPPSLETPCSSIEHLLNRCLAPSASKRFKDAGTLANAIQSTLEVETLERQLPHPGVITTIAERYPMGTLVFFVLAPQFLGSLVNISYNAMRIVSALTPAQQGTFKSLVIYYNLVIYPLCTWIVVKQLRPIPRCLTQPALLCDETPQALKDLRLHVLRLPDWLVFVCFLGWMPGSLIFPFAIHWVSGPIPTQVFGHFFTSFTLSCLIAMTYSFLYTQFVALRVFYPRLWAGERDIQRTARGELAREEARLRVFHLMAGIVPLAGAILVLLVGPEKTRGVGNYQTYRFLLFSLILMGMVGLGFALRSAGLISQTLYALTGNDPKKN